jgi:hypothetical protein
MTLSVALVLFVLAEDSIFANALSPPMGFHFCAPVFPPKCIDADETYDHAARARNCINEVSRYSVSVSAYRACLLQETYRATLEANKNLERFNCRTSPQPNCSSDKK